MIGKLIKEVILYLSALFILFIVFLLIGRFLGGPKWVSELFAYVLIISTFTYLLKMVYQLLSKKTKYNKKLSLYSWLDDLSDFDELLVYSLKRQPTSYGTLKNLDNVKGMLVKQTLNDKSTLKMYRIFYSQKLKESGEELYLRTIMIIIIPAVIALFGQKFFEINSLEVLTFATITILLLAFISMKLSLHKKRNGILVDLIDLCIQEIEDEEKQKI
ncbi:hypothetical protein CSV75_04515 [Sporosarcina sp. P18a]|uniref:hypothetical protein n=1 Tax=Sporosarcina sp. P18a TaxID=2048259 RepID=UPI000C17317A|nr:hypothetical protein [Sporosarcina sp. P18a]PIC81048.1 hypothetical protein CSV75_04515 [Sporosarcina sp. P18a]